MLDLQCHIINDNKILDILSHIKLNFYIFKLNDKIYVIKYYNLV